MVQTRKQTRQRGGDRNDDFLQAILAQDVNTVQRMLQEGLDPSFGDQDPIYRATYVGNLEIVRLLLQDPRVDPSARDQQPIKNACAYGNTAIVQLLLQDQRVNPSGSNTGSAFHYAILRGNIDTIFLLLKDRRVYPGRTPQKAAILDTIPSKQLSYMILGSQYNPEQFLITLDHFLEKASRKQNLDGLIEIQALQTQTHKDLPTNVTNYMKPFLTGLPRTGRAITDENIRFAEGRLYGPNIRSRRSRSRRRTGTKKN